MTGHEIDSALIRMKKNPHSIEKYSKEDLYDMMMYLQEKHREDSLFYSNIYNLNKEELVKNRSKANTRAIAKKLIKAGEVKEMTIENFVNDQPTIRNRIKLYELMEKRYESLLEPDQELTAIEEEEDHTKFTKGQIYLLLDKLGLFDNTSTFNKNIPLIKDKQKVIEKILGCGNRTAKALLNEEDKYMPPNEKVEQVEFFLSKKLKGH